MTDGATETRVLHNRLAVLRAERGTSRRDLARAVGINVQTVGFLERGDYGPSVELALRLAHHFGLPVEAVFSLAPFTPMSAQLYTTPVTTGQHATSPTSSTSPWPPTTGEAT